MYVVYDISASHEGDWLLKRVRNTDRLGRFEEEVAALERLDSPHIPRVVDHSIVYPAFLVYKKVGDRTLQDVCADNVIDIGVALNLFEQIVSAACHAHDVGIAHRDIKPNNVCVSSDLRNAFLIDFGICQFVNRDLLLTATDEPLGNALFAAPECMPGSQLNPGPHSDVYSLGKLLYWMCSGGRHIHREDISEQAVHKIVHTSDLVKYHIGRLLHGTIVGDPSCRWTSTTLREMTREVMQLLQNFMAREKSGIITVSDAIGLNDGFNGSSSRSVAQAPRGNPPSSHDLAEQFLVTSDVDVELQSVAIALRNVAGVGSLVIAVREDEDGAPANGLSIEELHVHAASPWPTVAVAESTT